MDTLEERIHELRRETSAVAWKLAVLAHDLEFAGSVPLEAADIVREVVACLQEAVLKSAD